MASRQLSSTMTATMMRLSPPSSIRPMSTIRLQTPRITLPSLVTSQPRSPRTAWLAPQQTQTQTRALHSPYKDSQERDSLKPRRNEGTATGSDDEVANMHEAWDTGRTRPEEELEESRREGGWSMLDESGGNQAFSKPQGDSPSENRGAEKSGKKPKSGETKTKKHGVLKPKA